MQHTPHEKQEINSPGNNVHPKDITQPGNSAIIIHLVRQLSSLERKAYKQLRKDKIKITQPPKPALARNAIMRDFTINPHNHPP